MKELLYLIQTDTTVGFLSKSQKKLFQAKKRDSKKPFLKVISSFKELKKMVRVPKNSRRIIRNSDKITYIYKNNLAIRVVYQGNHHHFLKQYGTFYSSSANISGEKFNIEQIITIPDIICFNNKEFFENNSSNIIKIGKNKKRKLR